MPTLISDADIEDIIARNYPAQTTRDNYLHRLHILSSNVFQNSKSLYDILASPEESYTSIRGYYPNINTRKNVLTLILALFKHSTKLSTALPSQLARWREFHGHMDSFQEARYKKHMPSDKQMAKYTPLEDIERTYKDLRNKSQDPHKTLADSLQFVLLSIVTQTPPKRSDYGMMRIYHNRDPNLSDQNYVVLVKNDRDSKQAYRPSYMVFNKYKTAKAYKRVDQELPRKVTHDIRDSLRRYPREFLFENRFGQPFQTNNAFSKFVVRTFSKLFGRDTGVSMLRHIYITEKLMFDEMDDDDREREARLMMHDPKTQWKYKWNKAAICSRLSTMCPAASHKRKQVAHE